jgi:hypothetical protein
MILPLTSVQSFWNELEKIAEGPSLEKVSRSYIKDAIGGIDPLGIWTNQYGQDDERAGMSKKDQNKRHAVATVGGFVGGSTVAPSAIYGVMEGAKGLAGGGTMGQRLARGGKNFVEGFKFPVGMTYKAIQAHKALKGKGGRAVTLQPGQADQLRDLVSAAAPIPEGQEGAFANAMAKIRGGVDDKIQAEVAGAQAKVGPRVAEQAQATRDLLGNKAPGWVPDPLVNSAKDRAQRATAGVEEAASQRISREIGQEGAAAQQRASAGIDAAQQQAQQMATPGTPLTLGADVTGPTEAFLRDQKNDAMSQLAFGGAIGAAGANIQYRLGVGSEQDFQKRVASIRGERIT